MSGTLNDAIIGAVVGNIFGTDRLMICRDTSPETLNDDIQTYIENSTTLSVMSSIIRSMKQYDGFWIDDIRSKIKAIDKAKLNITPDDGSVLCWIYLASFSDIVCFTNNDSFDDIIRKICEITHNNDDTINLCITYCQLIHDIFWNWIDIDGILEILPELDILAGDVPIYQDARSTFFAGLWAFVHSKDYFSAVNNCTYLDHNKNFTNWIPTIAGTLAGLYYGADSIPKNMIEDFDINKYLNTLTF